MIQQEFSATTKEITKEQIWKLMSNVNEWKNWDPSVERSELKGNFEAGSIFLLRPKGGPNVKIKLVDVIQASYFKDETTFPLAQMHGEHWYEETPEGLKIKIRMTMTGLLAPLWNKLVMEDIVSHLSDDVQSQITAAKKL